MYVRFVDDIFGTWNHGVDALLQFEKEANNIHLFVSILFKNNSGLTELIYKTKPQSNYMILDKFKSIHGVLWKHEPSINVQIRM